MHTCWHLRQEPTAVSVPKKAWLGVQMYTSLQTQSHLLPVVTNQQLNDGKLIGKTKHTPERLTPNLIPRLSPMWIKISYTLARSARRAHKLVCLNWHWHKINSRHSKLTGHFSSQLSARHIWPPQHCTQWPPRLPLSLELGQMCVIPPSTLSHRTRIQSHARLLALTSRVPENNIINF